MDALWAFVASWTSHVAPALAVAVVAALVWMQSLDERSAVRAARTARSDPGQTPSVGVANVARGFQRVTARIVIVCGLIYLFDPFVRDYAATAIRFRSERIAAQTTPGIIIMASLIAVTLVNAVAAIHARPSARASDDPRDSRASAHPIAAVLLWLIPVPCALLFAHFAQGGASMPVSAVTVLAIVGAYLLSWVLVGRIELAQGLTNAT